LRPEIARRTIARLRAGDYLKDNQVANGKDLAGIFERFKATIKQAVIDVETELTDWLIKNNNHIPPDKLAKITDPPNGTALRG